MIQAICWMLIHSLWQGLLLTIFTGFVLVYTRRAAAAVRYNLLSGLYFLFLAGCGLTFILEWNDVGKGDVGGQVLAAFSGSRLSSFIATVNEYLSDHASLIVMGWCFIFLFKCVRITAAVVYTQRVRHYGVTQPPVYWKDKIQAFCGELQIKRTVLLLESRLVKMPFVTGHWKPVIFIPLGLLTKLPEGEIEAVLLHELAHIRRNDYVMNFLQHFGESIFFFNPGLLWISSLLREERENCADDMAIDRTRNKQAFVRALIHFREHNLRLAGVALAFPAGKNQLLHRVMRIVDNKNKSLNKAERIFFIASFFIISLLLVAATHQVLRPVDTRYNTIQPYEPVPPGGLAYDRGVQTGADPDWSLLRAKIRQDEAQPPASSEDEQSAEEVQAIEEEEQNKIQADEKKVPVIEGRRQVTQDRQQAMQDRQQAIQDRQQADRDREQAEKDRQQVKLDRDQADQDRRLAAEGRDQAQLDKLQEEKMQELERLEKMQADKSDVLKKGTQTQMAKAAIQAVILRKQAKEDKVQAEKGRLRITTVITTRTTETQSTGAQIVQVSTH